MKKVLFLVALVMINVVTSYGNGPKKPKVPHVYSIGINL